MLTNSHWRTDAEPGMIRLDHRCPSTAAQRPKAFDKKIVLYRQLADLGVQRLHLRLSVRSTTRRLLGEHLGKTLLGVSLPLCDHAAFCRRPKPPVRSWP